MTYGEALQLQKENMKLVNGKWTAPQLKEHTHLTEDEAIVYYNKKLRRLWKKQGYYKAKKWKLYGYPNYKDRTCLTR